MSVGYSGTPLATKLSLKAGMRVWFADMPQDVLAQIDADALALDILSAPEAGLVAAHIFVTERAEMVRQLAALRPMLAPAGFIWVSWPKKASKVPTDITEDAIRAVILPDTDLVDVKVCAVDTVWSGLKLMIRKDRR
jgi:streptogramin lyase